MTAPGREDAAPDQLSAASVVSAADTHDEDRGRATADPLHASQVDPLARQFGSLAMAAGSASSPGQHQQSERHGPPPTPAPRQGRRKRSSSMAGGPPPKKAASPTSSERSTEDADDVGDFAELSSAAPVGEQAEASGAGDAAGSFGDSQWAELLWNGAVQQPSVALPSVPLRAEPLIDDELQLEDHLLKAAMAQLNMASVDTDAWFGGILCLVEQESPPLAQKLKTGSFGSTGELSAALEQLDGSHFFWLCTSVTIMQRFSDFCRGRA